MLFDMSVVESYLVKIMTFGISRRLMSILAGLSLYCKSKFV